MKQIKKGKRLLAVALSMLLAFGGLPTAALAEGPPVQATQGLCEHHLEHTVECGYGEGQPCEHKVNGGRADRESPLGGEHSEDCYTDELTCGYKVNGGLGRDEEKETTASDSDAEHTHTQECYALDCPHERGEHNADCGYAEAQPCGYTCELCGKTDNEQEPKPGEETEQTACTLTEGCTLADGHEGECATVPGEGEKETACTLTEGCTLPDGHEGECATELPPANDALAKIITSWTFVATDYSDYTGNEFAMPSVSMERQADFDTVVSMLPTGISAEIEGETDPVPVDITGWSCPEYVRDDDDNWPITGEYVFTAELQSGYVCAPLPTVKVLIGGAELYGETINGNGYSFDPASGKLTVSSNDGTTAWRKEPSLPNKEIVTKLEITTDVTAIGEGAFWGCGIESVTIPNSVTAIGEYAFEGCTKLTSVTLAEGLKAGIGVFAFRDCTSLTSITIPNSVTAIGEYAFLGCTSLTSITIPNSVTAIGANAFLGCTKLTSVTLAEGLKAGIGEYAFRDCTSLTSITIPNSVTAIGANAFLGCTKLTSVTLAEGLKAGIGAGAFKNCQELTSINIPGSVKNIGENAFFSCTKLKTVNILEGVTTIGENTFQQCAALETVTIPSSVTSIGGGAFYGCWALKTMTINKTSAPSLGGSALGNTPGWLVIHVPNNATGYEGENWPTEKVLAGASLTGLTISSGTLTPTFSPKETNYTVTVPYAVMEVTVKPTAHSTGTITVNGNDVTSDSNSENISLAAGGDTKIDIVVKNSESDNRKYTVTVTREKASPTLSLSVDPTGSLALPGSVTLTATLSGAVGGSAGKTIHFTASGIDPVTNTTDGSGAATYTFANLTPGTYSFGASFAGDGDNKSASAKEISGYTVSRGKQEALSLIGLDNAYTYGDKPFGLSTSGGSGGGAVSYQSSDTSVASVTGDQVTIRGAGTFTITATKAGDANYDEAKVTSGTVTVHPATPGVSLTATGGANINDPIVLTAVVTKVETGTTPTGTVTFSEGDKILADNVILNGSGEATCTVSNLTAGNHTYTVAYSGHSGYYNPANANRTVGVGLADQTGFTVNDPGAKTYGDNEFTLTAAGGQSSGGVSFSVPDGSGVLTVTADGKVTITGAGKVTVTVTKAGDNNYNSATDTLELTVAPRDIANVTVNVTGSRAYTGSQLQPDFVVSDSSIAINTGDYINEYGINVDTGAGAGSIKLIGQRNYTGTKTVAFDIEKRPLDGAAITLEAVSYTHTGGEIKPAVTKVVVDEVIVPASEFDVGYANNTAVGTATVTITAKADGNFSGTASTTFEITKSNNSSGGGGGSNGGSSSSNDSTVTAPKDSYTSTGKQIGQSVSRSDLQRLANTGKSLTIQSGTAAMTFDPAALKAILAAVPATSGNITFAATPADISAFPEAAKLIGTHSVYSFTISYKDSKGNAIPVNVNFPAGSASISLNYTPAEGEVAGSLFMVYVDGKGAVTWLDKSSYTGGRVLAGVPHFSVYGVACKAPVPIFTDITNHWAKADMEFVAARGLLSGTGEKVFSPDAAMTRGMFVTALGRLAGVGPASYQTRSFTDVKADAYYAAYVEWAAQKNIAGGTGEGLFSPDAPVTREQMAVMMTNYAGQMGYSIPTPLAAVTFADNDKIGAWAAKEVAAMQRAGIIKGKDGNRFDPQGNATRAEGASVLRRFVEIAIDPVTAQGWVKNDSGQWLYYKDGKAITGWQQIGGKWYYFDKNGIMAVNTKIDGYEIGPDGERKENH